MEPSPRRSPRLALSTLGKSAVGNATIPGSPMLKRPPPGPGVGLENQRPVQLGRSGMRDIGEASPTLPARRKPRRSSGHNKRVSFGGETVKFIEQHRDDLDTPPRGIRAPLRSLTTTGTSPSEDTVTMPSLQDILNQGTDSPKETLKFTRGTNFFEEDITQCGPLRPHVFPPSEDPTLTVTVTNPGIPQAPTGDSPTVTHTIENRPRSSLDPDDVTMPIIRLATLADEDELEEEYARNVAQQGLSDEDVSITTKIPSIHSLLDDDGTIGYDCEDTIDNMRPSLAQVIEEDEQDIPVQVPLVDDTIDRSRPSIAQLLEEDDVRPQTTPQGPSKNDTTVASANIMRRPSVASVASVESLQTERTALDQILSAAGFAAPDAERSFLEFGVRTSSTFASEREYGSLLSARIQSMKESLGDRAKRIQEFGDTEILDSSKLDMRSLTRVRRFCESSSQQELQKLALSTHEKFGELLTQEIQDLNEANALLTERSSMYRRNIEAVLNDTAQLRSSSGACLQGGRANQSKRNRISHLVDSIRSRKLELSRLEQEIQLLETEKEDIQTDLKNTGEERIALRRVTIPSANPVGYFKETLQAFEHLSLCSGLRVMTVSSKRLALRVLDRFLVTFEAGKCGGMSSSLWSDSSAFFADLSVEEQHLLSKFVENSVQAMSDVEIALNRKLSQLLVVLFRLHSSRQDVLEFSSWRGGSVVLGQSNTPGSAPILRIRVKFSDVEKLRRFFCEFSLNVEDSETILRCSNVEVDFGACPSFDEVSKLTQESLGRNFKDICREISQL